MLKWAFGCCKGVSGCTEGASGCVYLPAPEMTNRDAGSLLKSILNTPFEQNLGKSSHNEARINAIINKRIETQRIKDLKYPKIWFSHCRIYISSYTIWSGSFFSLTTLDK